MLTRVSDWFALLAGLAVFGGIALALAQVDGETVAYSCVIGSLLAVPLLKGAWATFKIGWAEDVRMARREGRYGQPKGDSWKHGY